MSQTKHISFNHKPLAASCNIALQGSVSIQSFQGLTGEFTPDYAVTPLCLKPRVTFTGRTSGEANSHITDFTWRVSNNGTGGETDEDGYTILSGEADASDGSVVNVMLADGATLVYKMTISGSDTGMIQVCHNVYPDAPLQLIFKAKVTDPVTGQTMQVQASWLVRTANDSDPVPQLLLDWPSAITYDPWNDPASRTVNARILLGESSSDDSPASFNYSMDWQVSRDDGRTWTALGDDGLDYFLTASQTASRTFNLSLAPSAWLLRCVATVSWVSAEGAKTHTLENVVSIVRQLPKHEADIMTPSSLPECAATFSPRAIVRVSGGEVTEADVFAEMLPLWKVGTKQVGEGIQPQISTSCLDGDSGALLELDLADRGPWCALTGSDGSLITDSDGKVILIR